MQLLIQLVREILYLSGKSPLGSSQGIAETSGCENHVLPCNESKVIFLNLFSVFLIGTEYGQWNAR